MSERIVHVGSARMSGSGIEASVVLPDDAAEGDLMVVVASADSSTNTIILPEGITQVFSGDVPNDEVGATKISVGYRFLDGALDALGFTFGESDAFALSVHVYRGVGALKPGNPEFSYVVRGPSGNPSLPACPSVTTKVDGCAILNIVSDSRGPNYSEMDWVDYYQPPQAVTEITDISEYAGTGYAGHAVGWSLQETAGETGETQWDSIDNHDGGFAGTLVLMPVADQEIPDEEEPVDPEEPDEPVDPEDPEPDEPAPEPEEPVQGVPGPAPQMRTEEGAVQWKHEGKAAWEHLFTIPKSVGTGTSNGRGLVLTSGEFGISPGSNANTNRVNIQNFIDHCYENHITGILEVGRWTVNDQLKLRNGMRLMGRGMGPGLTFIDAPTNDWDGSSFTVMKMEVDNNGGNLNNRGLYLADFRVAGPDKTRGDTGGGLIRLHAVDDLLVERLRLEDASSYNLYIAGYGKGSFTNDIKSEFWNSTHRGTVRDCLALRGQIGFGTEGGAEDLLFDRCVSIGNYGVADDDWGLHGYRSASGYGVTYRKCKAYGYRNGMLLDRYKNVHVDGCHFEKTRNGIAPGSFYADDPEISHDLRITNNYFNCQSENGNSPVAINDSYVGSGREVRGVVIQGNVVKKGDILLRRSHQMNVQGNTSMDKGSRIVTGGNATGLVANNTMDLSNGASGVKDGGNNGYFGA